MVGAVRMALAVVSGFLSVLGWYPFEMRFTDRLSRPGRGFRCVFSVFWIDTVDWLWLAYGELPNRMSLNPWLILLSTLSLRDMGSGSTLPSVALFGPDSSDVGRSNRRRSRLAGVVGDTMDATLMLLADGETSGARFVVVGDGVLSVGDG
jgi:hypothetical protein